MAKVAFKAKKLPKVTPPKNWPVWPQMTKDGKASPKVVKLVKLTKGVKKGLYRHPWAIFADLGLPPAPLSNDPRWETVIGQPPPPGQRQR